jgi:hypothetical protein
MRLYYRIWMDCITRMRSREINKDNWQLKSMIVMSIAMTFNLVLILSILQKHLLNCYFYKLNISFLSNYENVIFTILILFLLPCVIINYLLIFHGKRYEKLSDKYSYYDGKLFSVYFLTSIFLPLILMWISIFLHK